MSGDYGRIGKHQTQGDGIENDVNTFCEVEQHNFDDDEPTRMREMPKVEMHT